MTKEELVNLIASRLEVVKALEKAQAMAWYHGYDGLGNELEAIIINFENFRISKEKEYVSQMED